MAKEIQIKRFKLIDVIIALLFLSVLILAVCDYLSNAYAEDYIITVLGDYKAVIIEHDDNIHVMGWSNSKKGWDFSDDQAQITMPEGNYFAIEGQDNITFAAPSTLELARKQENEEKWYSAGCNYFLAGDIEKVKEMAYKDIDKELKKEPPAYLSASVTSRMLLKDREMALYYYIKYLDQILEDD